MENGFGREAMRDLYASETLKQISQLENITSNNDMGMISDIRMNEIFRLLNTIKGFSKVLKLDCIVPLILSIEEIYQYILEHHLQSKYDKLVELILKCMNVTKDVIFKLQFEDTTEYDVLSIQTEINQFFTGLKEDIEGIPGPVSADDDIQTMFQVDNNNLPCYKALIFFEDGCEMENIRAYNVVYQLQKIADRICYYPSDMVYNQDAAAYIREYGFIIKFYSELDYHQVKEFMTETLYISKLDLELISPSVNENKSSQCVKYDKVRQEQIEEISSCQMESLMRIKQELEETYSSVVRMKEWMDFISSDLQNITNRMHKVKEEMNDWMKKLEEYE